MRLVIVGKGFRNVNVKKKKLTRTLLISLVAFENIIYSLSITALAVRTCLDV